MTFRVERGADVQISVTCVDCMRKKHDNPFSDEKTIMDFFMGLGK